MKLECLGAGQEVGRSALLLKGKENILLDYGLKLNPASSDVDPEGDVFLSKTEYPKKIKDPLHAIILSHAHLDHSGAIPYLYKQSLQTPLFLTPPTLDLSNLLWEDTIKIAKITGNDAGFKPQDIITANDSAYYLDYKKQIQITPNTKVTFYDAGHVVGSVISVVEQENQKVMYTGDFRGSESQMFRGYDKKLPAVDYLITETTYGVENHRDRKEQEKLFTTEILETLENGGSIILPAFAIERSQELISILAKYKINNVPIYLDGMSKKATMIFSQYPEFFTDFKSFKKAVEKVEFVKNRKKRDKVINKQCIIISTAGMLEGGPALGYIKELGADPKNRIILSGYQVKETNGYRLEQTGKLLIDGKSYQPRAKVTKHSFSAHAGRDEILDLIKRVNPRKVICVHGDKKVTNDFKEELKRMGIDAVNPQNGETVELQ